MASQSSTHSALLSSQWPVDLCCFSLLRCSSPFSIFPYGSLIPRTNLQICLTGRGWCVNRRSKGSHSCLALWSCFLSYSWMFAKEAFWFNCSLLDYVIMAFEFFIRSFLSSALGLRGTCFLAFDAFEKSGYLYHCSFALILWLLLWGAFWCAEYSFVCLLHGMCLWFVFVLGTNHPSCSLLCKLSWKQAIADQFFWKTCVCWKLYRKFSILRDIVPSLGGDEWHCRVALQQCSDFPSAPFSCVQKKYCHYSSLIKRIFLKFCCIYSFQMILTEVPGEKDS